MFMQSYLYYCILDCKREKEYIYKSNPLGIVVKPTAQCGLSFRDMPQSAAYPNTTRTTSRTALPNFLSEGCRYNARQKSRRWAVLRRTAHCRDFLLAAVDVCLITRNLLYLLKLNILRLCLLLCTCALCALSALSALCLLLCLLLSIDIL